MYRYISTFALGYIASKFFNKPLHQDGVPEVIRYIFGGILIVFGYRVFGASEREVENLILASGSIGLGVIIARL